MNLLFAWPEWVPDWFASWGWIVLIVAVVVLIAAIVVCCVLVSKRKRAAAEDSADPSEPAYEESGAQSAESVSEELDEPVEDDGEQDDEPAEEQPQRAKKQPKTAEQATPVENGGEEEPAKAKAVTKTYHIGKRKADGKWQVKIAGGSKAIKLFSTQLEAINYAKKLAENQEAKIVIHKEDGTFRRLTYHNKNK